MLKIKERINCDISGDDEGGIFVKMPKIGLWKQQPTLSLSDGGNNDNRHIHAY